MKKVLVTGAGGQLGQCLEKIKAEYEDLHFIFKTSKELDITDKDNIQSNFTNHQPDYCINCAAYTYVDKAEEEPEKAFAVNADGAKKLAEACKEFKTILIHISTDYVFDGEKDFPYLVNDVPNPINQYGKSKLLGETYIQDTLDEYFIVRTSWLYSEFGTNFYKTILSKAKEEEVLYVTDEQLGSPTNATNLAQFLIQLISSKFNLYGIYHFTDKEIMTWFKFAKRIVEQNDIDCIVEARNYSTFAARPKYSVLESHTIEEL